MSDNKRTIGLKELESLLKIESSFNGGEVINFPMLLPKFDTKILAFPNKERADDFLKENKITLSNNLELDVFIESGMDKNEILRVKSNIGDMLYHLHKTKRATLENIIKTNGTEEKDKSKKLMFLVSKDGEEFLNQVKYLTKHELDEFVINLNKLGWFKSDFSRYKSVKEQAELIKKFYKICNDIGYEVDSNITKWLIKDGLVEIEILSNLHHSHIKGGVLKQFRESFNNFSELLKKESETIELIIRTNSKSISRTREGLLFHIGDNENIEKILNYLDNVLKSDFLKFKVGNQLSRNVDPVTAGEVLSEYVDFISTIYSLKVPKLSPLREEFKQNNIELKTRYDFLDYLSSLDIKRNLSTSTLDIKTDLNSFDNTIGYIYLQNSYNEEKINNVFKHLAELLYYSDNWGMYKLKNPIDKVVNNNKEFAYFLMDKIRENLSFSEYILNNRENILGLIDSFFEDSGIEDSDVIDIVKDYISNFSVSEKILKDENLFHIANSDCELVKKELLLYSLKNIDNSLKNKEEEVNVVDISFVKSFIVKDIEKSKDSFLYVDHLIKDHNLNSSLGIFVDGIFNELNNRVNMVMVGKQDLLEEKEKRSNIVMSDLIF